MTHDSKHISSILHLLQEFSNKHCSHGLAIWGDSCIGSVDVASLRDLYPARNLKTPSFTSLLMDCFPVDEQEMQSTVPVEVTLNKEIMIEAVYLNPTLQMQAKLHNPMRKNRNMVQTRNSENNNPPDPIATQLAVIAAKLEVFETMKEDIAALKEGERSRSRSSRNGEEIPPCIPAPLQPIVTPYMAVFEEPRDLPPTRSQDHSIPLLPNSTPPNIRPYPYPHSQKDEIEKQVEQLMAAGFIQPSTSPFASTVLLVKKKDNTWRMPWVLYVDWMEEQAASGISQMWRKREEERLILQWQNYPRRDEAEGVKLFEMFYGPHSRVWEVFIGRRMTLAQLRVLGVVTPATILGYVVQRYYTVPRRYLTALGPALDGQRALSFMNLLNEGCSANPPAQNQPFPGYSSKYASMTPEQFQQHQQEQQEAFFRWQQSQVLNREFQDLQQNSPSFNSETSQSLTQPQQVDSSKKGDHKKTKSKRGKNVEDKPVAAGRWLPVEEELLATCYVAVSEDNNVRRSQKHETFWYRVLKEFNSKKFQKRTKDMLTSKWQTLNANCQKFNAAYKRVKRLGKSDENDVDLMKRAQSIYRDEHKGVSFSQEDAWAILKFHPKWDAPEQVDLTGDVPRATQEDLFGHDARPCPAGKPRPAKKIKSDVTTSTDGSSTSTKFGELMEQELRLKRKAPERAFEAQAEKDRTLMRLEELKFLATSTKDLDDDDAYWIKKQKRLIKNKMRNNLGDEDDEDE
uniref:Transposon Ty3-I Gag-Pol polyprotein n=1 Tax=Tanacetum cinerariifolium TaxID=118510 RepID=A0A6L2LE45_TANCI|nr:transposon Ty3-I Gag-Pol polyprotein [Tanacetum cinerariifolium]